MSMGNRIWQTAGVLALAALFSTGALAQVSARLVVVGGAANSTKIAPGGAATFEARVDAAGAPLPVYSYVYQLKQTAPVAPPGFFTITNRVDIQTSTNPPYVFNDTASGLPNATVLALPSAFLNPTNGSNLGRNSTDPVNGIPPANNLLASTLTLTADPATPLGTYTISLATGSTVSTTDGMGGGTDYAVTATFDIIVGNTLTVTKSGTGTGTVADPATAINCGATCTDIVPGTANLTATPAPGSTFVGWTTGPCAATTTNPCAVSLAGGPVTVNAQFDLLPQTMNVTLAGAGTGGVTSSPAGINCGATCTAVFPANTVVTLTATPTGTSVFSGWSGACSGTGTCVVTMNQTQNVTATFSLQPFPLTVTKSGLGTGTVTSAPVGIACGATCTFQFSATTVVTLTAVADPGKTFTGWSGGGCSGTGTCVVTIAAATTVNAAFGDTQAPTTTITGTPTNPSNSPNPQFTFTADESPVTFTCKLDSGAPFTCVSGVTVAVNNGNHTFTVFATDPAGNVGAPVSYSWTAQGIIVANVPVPTLNEWMLVLLALILGTAGFLARRRSN